jgi:hydroxymethylbilane synthase
VWTSVADQWNAQPKQLFFESSNTQDYAESIVEKIRSVKPRKVFISKSLRETDYLFQALSRLNFAVQSKSLIEFKEIRFGALPQADWIFFSSKHAVRFFFSQNPKLGDVKFGCIGTATSAELRKHGYRADFIGQSTDTKLVGKQFAARVGSSKVLFPSAKESMQSVQLQMPKKDNVYNLPVYATIKHSAQIADDTEILVFTSPSNVESYFAANKWLRGQFAVAMGDATASALERHKVKGFDDLGLFRAILSVS